jgi:hypothetical protein
MTKRLILVFALLGAGPALAQGADQALIARNQEQLKTRLPDPGSARFRAVFVSRHAGVPVACGEVAAKTVTGEDSGFMRFVGAGSLGVFLPGDVDDFDALWRHFCG